MAQKVGRREIYSPVPPPLLGLSHNAPSVEEQWVTLKETRDMAALTNTTSTPSNHTMSCMHAALCFILGFASATNIMELGIRLNYFRQSTNHPALA